MHLKNKLALIAILFPVTVFAQSPFKIMFTSYRNGVRSLFVIDADGKNERPLTKDPKNCEFAVTSPTGKSVAFLRATNFDKPIYANPTAEIFIMKIDGTDEKQLTFNQELDYTPTWSPDGKHIYFTRKGRHERIYRMNADGSNEQPVTDTTSYNVCPSVSPDNRLMAFHTYRHEVKNPELYVMEINGNNPRRLTDSPGWDYEPNFSPDGKSIVFSSNRHGGSAEIYRMDADGKNARRLTHQNKDCWNGFFSPDGKTIVFQSGDETRWQLFTMSADGSGLKQISNSSFSNYGPRWIR